VLLDTLTPLSKYASHHRSITNRRHTFLLSQSTLPNTALVILLDTTRPYTFSRSCTPGSLGLSTWSIVTARKLESSAKCITSAVCSCNPCSCSLVLTVAHCRAGVPSINTTLNHLPSRFLRSSALVPSGPGTPTHNIVGVPTVLYHHCVYEGY
jgi:hypothetical protein